MEFSKTALLMVVLAYVERCWAASCVVDSFTVKQDFDPKRVSLFLNSHHLHTALHSLVGLQL